MSKVTSISQFRKKRLESEVEQRPPAEADKEVRICESCGENSGVWLINHDGTVKCPLCDTDASYLRTTYDATQGFEEYNRIEALSRQEGARLIVEMMDRIHRQQFNSLAWEPYTDVKILGVLKTFIAIVERMLWKTEDDDVYQRAVRMAEDKIVQIKSDSGDLIDPGLVRDIYQVAMSYDAWPVMRMDGGKPDPAKEGGQKLIDAYEQLASIPEKIDVTFLIP